MLRSRRLFAALTLALLCAPGTFVRTPPQPPGDIPAVQVQGAGPTPAPDWQVAGVWQYDDGHAEFGGLSALVALRDSRLQAFSDRAIRFTFGEPDQPRQPQSLTRQRVAPADEIALWDIEAATQDPATGRYWLAYENHHAIHRFTPANAPDGKRDLVAAVDWPKNAGAEAMVRLRDGRFVVLPEGRRYGLIYPGDPVKGGKPRRFAFRNPAPGFAATDLVELPDGRLLLLLRDLAWAYPVFTSRLAIGPAPQAGGEFAPSTVLRLDPTVPRENYEGLAVRLRADGRVDVWVMSDSNLSVMQRTLLVKLIYQPQRPVNRRSAKEKAPGTPDA